MLISSTECLTCSDYVPPTPAARDCLPVRLFSLPFVLQALRLLSEDFVQKHPGLKQQVLNNSVVLGNNRKLAVEAISVLQGHSQALLSGTIPLSPSAFGCCT